MAGFVKVAKTDEIVPGQGKIIEVGGKKIALFNVEGSFYAIDDTCTHRGGPLSEGVFDGKEITCPWHGATYDVTSGEVLGVLRPPKELPVTMSE
jgi:nitrite reductase/ring-hydroxylating ferredoxin subunit